MIVRSSLCLLATIVFTLADDPSSNSVLSVKRDPMDFEGMREKKSFASSEDGDISKRGRMLYQRIRGKKDSMPADIEHELLSENVDKRAPRDFHVFRGKKDSLNPDLEDAYLSGDAYEKRAYYKQDKHYKRAQMRYQGSRGKKSLEEILDEIEKRNTMGFQDTRDPDTYPFDYSEDYETRIPSMTFGRFQQDGLRDKKDDILGEWGKRTPMLFQRMRGKKAILDAVEQLEKRALIADFYGFRGKKDDQFGNFLDYSVNPSEYAKRSTDFDEMDAGETPKRARMGFHGMRGTSNDRGYKAAAYEIANRSPFRYVSVRDTYSELVLSITMFLLVTTNDKRVTIASTIRVSVSFL